jgi:hypothetical protein
LDLDDCDDLRWREITVLFSSNWISSSIHSWLITLKIRVTRLLRYGFDLNLETFNKTAIESN